MSEHRMISKRITGSCRFLKMHLEAQALYFHLVQNADDHGFVEGFNVIKLTGSSKDSLSFLNDKGYIEILDENLALSIVDWFEHNNKN